MNCPFPGMNPWLEDAVLWPDVHFELISQIRRQLQPRVLPGYYVAAEERIFLEAPQEGQWVPDASIRQIGSEGGPTQSGTTEEADPATVILLEEQEVTEHFLELRTSGNHRLVAVIELLSPANKRPGAGRRAYQEKQQTILESQSHLIEIDLLRGGHATVAVPGSWAARSDYRVVVARANERKQREAYLFSLRDRLPRVALPLLPPDPDVILDLPAAFAQAFASGAYNVRIDHSREPQPPLSPADRAWCKERLT